MDEFMLLNRRSFVMTTVGLGSVPIASWATSLPQAQKIVTLSKSNALHRLPLNQDPLLISGRAVCSNLMPLKHCFLALKNEEAIALTDVDGRFFFKTTTTAFIHSNFELISLVNQQLTRFQDPTERMISQHLILDFDGDWRAYLEIHFD